MAPEAEPGVARPPFYMPGNSSIDAIVVGSGPNGLAAGIRLAQAGLSVRILEGSDSVGGGVRSAALTLPGFVHDVCSAIHPMAAASPFFRSLDLEQDGLQWVHPEFPVAHPLDGGRVAAMHRSIDDTASDLGEDGASYRRLIGPLAESWDAMAGDFLGPIVHWPKHPIRLARFGLQALLPARSLAEAHFRTEEARALFAGLAGHSQIPLDALASSAIAIVLGAAGHAFGWPMPRGGAQSLADALAARFRALGGEIETGRHVRRLEDLPAARATLLDVTVRQFIQMAGPRLPSRSRYLMERFRYGSGVFKIDYAMSEAVPWTNDVCARAGTIHLGGTLDEIAAAERDVADGRHPDRPFVLVAEHTRFDPTRAPDGKHTLWAYCHVPHGSTVDMTDQIERQIERFAPGFRDCILERHSMNAVDLERRNPNLIGGDINGGSARLMQLIIRPSAVPVPYRTPVDGVYLCSASTPPGGGVHGMCGYLAAEAALRDKFS